MSDIALIHVDYSQRSCVATAAAEEMKIAALESCALIAKVTNAMEQTAAVQAQTGLARVVKAVETAEEAVKRPLNDLRGRIIDTRKEFVKDLDTEGQRLARLIGEFQVKEQKRIAAETLLQQQQLAELEKQKLKEVAAAPTAEAQDRVLEKFSEIAKDVAAPIAPIRAMGQQVRTDWVIQVIDIWTLARAHPSCVKIEPLTSQIKSLLDAGVKVAGVKAEKETKSGVRLGPERKAIELTP